MERPLDGACQIGELDRFRKSITPFASASVAVGASVTAVSIRTARSGWISRARATTAKPVILGIRTSQSIASNGSCWSAASAPAPTLPVETSYPRDRKNFPSAIWIDASSSTIQRKH